MQLKKKIQEMGLAHAGQWFFYFVLIGIISGLGAILFHYLCGLGMHYFLDMMAGYRPSSPAGEHLLLPSTNTPFSRWMLLLLPALGGLFSGWLVYTFAPEAEGHGTDAAIDAYHHKEGKIRTRIPFIKTIASTVTLTTGGSGGREGPIAQIGAGFGSFLGTKLGLSARERRIMMAAGMGAGIGSIFRAPLAGALFAAEVLYRDPDFESEVIIPAGISSVVAYCMFCLVFGWGSLFDSPEFTFCNPLELGPYMVLSGILVLVGALYVTVFYGVVDLFHKWKIPNHIKPAIGGLITGIIGFFLPYTLAFGYGMAQQAILNNVAIPVLIALAIGKIFTTAFSIGSGGSGGVFGPSVVIGGAMGGAVGKIFHSLLPTVVTQPGSFVIVGMAGFFTAVSNTPISTIIFVSEMTNSYHLLLPSLLVCSLCYLLSRKWTIFQNQVKSRIDSPAHAGEFMMDILQIMKVEDMKDLLRDVQCVSENMKLSAFKTVLQASKQHYFPVLNSQGQLTGVFSSTDLRGVIFAPHIEDLVIMKDVMTSRLITTTLGEDLNTALIKLTQKNIDALPVVDEDDPQKLISMIYRRDVITFYNDYVRKNREASMEARSIT